MYTFLYIALFLFFLLITYLKFNKIVATNMIFTTIWCFGGIAANNMYAGLFPLSFNTNLYIMTSIIIFNSVYLLFSKKRNNYFTLKELQESFDYTGSVKVLLAVNLLSYIFMIPILLKAINIIQTKSWAILRSYAFTDSEVLASALQLRISSWIIYPVFLLTIIIAIIYLILQKKNSFLIIMAASNIIIYSLSFGARGLIVKSLVLFGIAIILIFQLQNKRIKIKKTHIIFGIIILYFLSVAISARSLGGLSVINNLIVYLVGSFSYFDVITTSIKYENLNNVFLYGSGMLGFILNPIIYIFSLLPGIDNFTSEYISKLVTANFEYVSESYMYNALPTSMYPFWRDFGPMGIIIGNILFAFFVVFIEKKFFERFNIRWFVLHLIFIYAVFESAMQYDLLTIQFSFLIITIFVFTSKKKILKPLREE